MGYANLVSMFNSTLTGNARVWFDDLPPESIDSYDDLKKTFLKNYLQEKKYFKDPIELHNIKQRVGQSTDDFVIRYKLEIRDVKGAPECMRILGFVHGITNPELIKCLNEKISKTEDEMMRVTTSSLRGEVAASNHKRKKSFPPWKQHEGNQKQNFKKGGFRNQQTLKRKQHRFSFLTKTPKEIFALDKRKFKAPPPMTTPVEKQNHAKFCEFHRKVRHNTNECMHLRKQIKKMLKAGKLSHQIKELKQNNGKEQPKVAKKEKLSGRIKQIFFPPLGKDEGVEGPMIIEAEIGGHCVHRMQIQLLVKIGDEEHSASVWMNFMIVRSQSPYNGIIRRPRVRKLQAVPSTGHGMLKISVKGRVITLKSSKLVPLECAMVSKPKETPSATKSIIEERVKRNLDIFAWKPAEMTGVPRHIAKHCLNMREGCSPVRQKKRGQAADRNQAIQEEVEKLVEAEIMREVHYHDWLSNPVVVKKHDDSWRMCVDFKDLNKACPKDGYPLPKIDWKTGRNLEVYIDNLVIKSCMEDEIVRDIEETFKTLREINMKQNPKKCAFGVEEGMFLGYKVNAKGLKVCPDKVDAVLNLPSLKCLKDVQKLNGKLACLNRKLISIGLRKPKKAFKQMKKLIAELPMLTAPMEKEKLIVYLAVTKDVDSAVLMTEKEAKQMPIYFVSRTLREEYAIHYKPRVSVKGQILADFIVERPEEDSLDTPMEEERELLETWILFTDGSSCTDSFEAGLILTNPEGMEFTYALRFRFDATNNEAEYEALIAGLWIAEQMGVKNLQLNVDSRLVANQVNRTYKAKDADMIHYLEKVKALTNSFEAFSIKQIPRSENKKADALSKIASTSIAHLSRQVLVKEQKEKSINEVEILTVVEEEGDTWMTPIFKYLAEGTLPADAKKARAIRRKSWRFAVINESLYKKSFHGPWLKCVGPLQANYVLREIHEGSCSIHAGTRPVVAKALRTGYYWPTMHKDARTLIRACQDCQVHKSVLRNPQQKLTPITSLWLFYKWRIEIAGPFLEGPGKDKFLIVAMDYFTKWIEEKPVATITGNPVKKFMWDIIACRFRLPGEIISDNGKKFRDDPFKDWCEKLCIHQHFPSVKHPQINGLVERANHSLREGIKARLDARSKKRIEELPHVLWAHRTMIKSSNEDTPFSLMYGTKAVSPAEIDMPTLRTAEVDLVGNNEALEINLDDLEERREEAAIREAKCKAKIEKYYNSKVRNISFKPGDLVYRNNDASRAEDTGKLGPKWEGPYKVTKALGKGAYKLRDRDEKQLSRTWNISNLKKYYVHKM
nr:reverse transcriptase domain-containing protein [Tanacetum cinerariifolium]